MLAWPVATHKYGQDIATGTVWKNRRIQNWKHFVEDKSKMCDYGLHH